jgi:putative transposase
MREEQFINGCYYHVFNRGVDKRRIFESQEEFHRFYQSLFLFNLIDYSNPTGYTLFRDDLLVQFEDEAPGTRETFVDILSYCLLPNHFHLLLKQNRDGGISQFMHRLSMGYARSFNVSHNRTGSLFEGPYKMVRIENEAQLFHVPRYIHLNALDLTSLNWRDGQISDWEAAEKRLEAYPWSSHQVYLGKPQELSVIHEPLVRAIFPTAEEYRQFLRGWTGRYVLRPPEES